MFTPLVLLAMTFALGIVIGKAISIPLIVICLSIIVFFFICLLSILKQKFNSLIPLLILVSLMGIAAYEWASLPPPPIKESFVTVIGTIIDDPLIKEDKALFTLKTEDGKIRVSTKASEVRYGDRVKLRGKLSRPSSASNPGLSDYSNYLAQRGIHAQLSAYRFPPKILSRGHGNWLIQLSYGLKHRLMATAKKTIPEPFSTLLCSIMFGSRASPPPPDIKEDYRRSGVVHILVASGMHLAILVGVCLGLSRFLGAPLTLSIVMVTLVNILYTLMTGAGPSIVRAMIMTQITMLGLLFEREKDFYTSLALAALVLLIINPLNLFDAGFQLSFGATWALVYMAPVFEERLKKFLPRFLSIPLAVSMAPVVVNTPITMYYFSQLSFIAVLTNALVISWVGVLVILGFASGIIGLLFLPLAYILNGTTLILLKGLTFLTHTFAHLPGACTFVKPPSLPLIVGYYIGLVGVIEILRSGTKFKMTKPKWAILGLFVGALLVWQGAVSGFSQAPPILKGKELVVTVLDVGQGDSILVEAPSGKKMLIDGGGRPQSDKRKTFDVGKSIVVPVLHRKGINKLDLVVLTHPHEDHVGGLPAVLEDLKVDMVLDSGLPHPSRTYRKFLKLIGKKKISYKIARRGQVISLGNDIKGYILNPSRPLLKDTNSDLNNNSIVIRLVYNRVAILLTGDIEKEGEKRVLNFRKDLRSQILKVGHHGSRTASSKRFLKAVTPKTAIISVGAHNKFKHPHSSALKRLEGEGAKIYGTDKNGAVIIRTDGERWIVETVREPKS